MLHSFQHNSETITVDLQDDFYGADYWNRVSRGEYEPDTVGFLNRHCRKGTTFVDIGAANGAMTLIAAKLGSNVYSYEPDPRMFEVAKRNVELNPNFIGTVSLVNRALSTQEGELTFSKGSNSNVLSDIVFSGNRSDDKLKIGVCSIANELQRIHTDLSKIIIKMDIEGAEWKILSDESTLESLAKHQAILLLAVHPGFHRPHKRIMPIFNRIFFEVWRVRNFLEARRLFSGVSKFATIKRTNLNPITSPNVFAVMCLVGYHEFIIEFNQVEKG